MSKLRRTGLMRPLDSLKRKERPWAFLRVGPGGVTTVTKYGELVETAPGRETDIFIRRLTDHVIFCNGMKMLLAATDPTVWTVKQRRERYIEARHDCGTKVIFLPAHLVESIDISAFSEYMEWLRNYGVYPTMRTGWSTLGRHLFLSSLNSPVRFFGPMSAKRASMYGGRKSAPVPAVYKNAVRWDITSAYPHSLAVGPLPRMLQPVKNPSLGLLNDDEKDGIAFAVVEVPYMRFPPLPQRADRRIVRLLKWESGVFSGWWTLQELRLAKDCGSRISLVSAWEGRLYHDDFSEWFFRVNEAKHSLSLSAGFLAKSHANLLWSSFSTSPSRMLYKRYDENRKATIIKVTEPGADHTLPTVYISSIVAARVRIRLHREMLAPGGNESGRVIHCDTDGGISDRKSAPKPLGRNPGDWRRVIDMPLIEVKSPNAYRYTCSMCEVEHPKWHYSVAGAKNIDSQRRAFERISRSRHPAAEVG